MRLARRAVLRGVGWCVGVVGLVGVLCCVVAGGAWASAEAPAYLGAQGRFTMDSQVLADRASVAVNVANGNLVVSGDDVRVAGRGLSLSLTRTYNARGGGAVGTAGRDWMLSLGADNTLTRESDGDVTWRGPTGEAYRFDGRTDGTFRAPPGLNASLTVGYEGTTALTDNRSGTVLSFNPPLGKLRRCAIATVTTSATRTPPMGRWRRSPIRRAVCSA